MSENHTMKSLLKYCLLALIGFLPCRSFAQFEKFKESVKDSVIQVYGVVMTADSLKALPGATVMVKGQNRGTYANEQGVFSIVVLKGDTLQFSYVGFKPVERAITTEEKGNQYSLLQLMTGDAQYMAATIIRARPTKEQFERDFVNNSVTDDALEIARKNNDLATRKALMKGLSKDGGEATNYSLNKYARSFYYAGQAPPQNIFNPFAWNEFIKAWKRGDFKSSN